MKFDIKLFIKSIALPLLVGIVAGLLTRNAMQDFQALNQPPLSPPGWLFPVVWTILYILMGVSSYLIKTASVDAETKSNAFLLYHYQLLVNFLWPIFFFNFGWYFFSLVWLILLWILVFFMIRQFAEISKPAAYLNIPYLIWLTFAAYLNAGVWWLNI
jgi:tryptophan-rich sensory protein